MAELLSDPSAWLSFLLLTVLEVVLGIDNVIFLSIAVAHLPERRQRPARLGGLALAMLTRVALLLSVTWLITLTTPLIGAFGRAFSGRDLILGAGGVFLLWKSVVEIHASIEGPAAVARPSGARRRFVPVILQIALVDIVFSLDSVFTAVGLAQRVEIMVAAIVLAVVVMMCVAGTIGAFIERHPTVKVLALAFLILIGMALIGDALQFHVPKGYLYFAMAFACAVEMINIRARRARA